MSRRRDFVASVTAAVSRVLPTAQVIVSKSVSGYQGKQKVKIGQEGGAIKLTVHDKDAGKKDIYVRVEKRHQALKAIRTVFSEQQIPVAA